MLVQKRASCRVDVSIRARCRTKLLTALVTVIDVSERGCRLRDFPVNIRYGDRICIRPQGLEPMWGQIRWMRRGLAGVEFERPLHPAVVQHIAQEHRRLGGQGRANAKSRAAAQEYRPRLMSV